MAATSTADATSHSGQVTPELLAKFREVVGDSGVLSEDDECLVYECDGYLVERQQPDCVVFPTTTNQVSEIVRLCHRAKVPIVPRGAGTSLAGGCLPIGGGVMVSLTKMTTIHEINLLDRYATVDAGVVNGRLNRELVGSGYHFAPDPSSGGASSIGGNVATNAGGPHTLKYGVTTNHVLGLEIVLPDGTVSHLGGPTGSSGGFDVTGLFVGSEGTFGFCTKVIVRLTRDPEALRTCLATFDSIDTATRVVSALVGRGIIPAAMELMDHGMLQAVEDKYHFGLPVDAGAVLIIEVDGLEITIDEQAKQVVQICEDGGSTEIRTANTDDERKLLWQCRKKAFGAIGRLSTSFCTQDGVVPRTKLPELMQHVSAVGEKFQLRIVNVFHAGDGNIHPILLFDERDADEVLRVLAASEEILDRCIELGGTVTGEHGIGVEKINFMHKMFTPVDLEMFRRLRNVFNPKQSCSPQKLIPDRECSGEPMLKRVHPGRRAAM